MTTIGIRELKAHLSRYLRRVRKGESLLVTDRGRGIATIMSVNESRVRQKALQLVRQGKLDWGGGKPTGLKHRVPCRGKSLSQTIREDRADRL